MRRVRKIGSVIASALVVIAGVARADVPHIDKFASIVSAGSCAFDVGVTLVPSFEEKAPTLSRQIDRAIAERCSLDPFNAELSAWRLAKQDETSLRADIGFFLRKAAWRGYYEANALTYVTPLAGSSDLGRSMIQTTIRPPSFSNDEWVDVRAQYFRGEKDLRQSSTLHGIVDGLGYTLTGRVDPRLTLGWSRHSNGEHIHIGCDTYTDAGHLCEVRVRSPIGRWSGAAFNVVFDGETGKPLRVCASSFYGGKSSAGFLKQANLRIDDELVSLEAATGCTNDNGPLVRKIEGASFVTASIVYSDETTPRFAGTSTVGFTTAERLLPLLVRPPHQTTESAAARDAMDYAASHSLKTVDDFVIATESWNVAADCVAAANDPPRECDRVLRRASEDWPEAGLERVTVGDEFYGYFGAPRVDLDRLEKSLEASASDISSPSVWNDPKFAARIARLKQEADRRRAAGAQLTYPFSVQLGRHEREIMWKGAPARAGFGNGATYAYAVSRRTAVARVERFVLSKEDVRPIDIICDGSVPFPCEIHVPFENIGGELIIRTSGEVWNSRLCLGNAALPDGPYFVTTEGAVVTVLLDGAHCGGRAETGDFLSYGDAFVLVAGSKGHRRQVAWAEPYNIGAAFEIVRGLRTQLMYSESR